MGRRGLPDRTSGGGLCSRHRLPERETWEEILQLLSSPALYIPLTMEYKPEGMGTSFCSPYMSTSWGTKQMAVERVSGGAGGRFWHSTKMWELLSRDTETRVPSNTYLMVRCQNMTQSCGGGSFPLQIRMWPESG